MDQQSLQLAIEQARAGDARGFEVLLDAYGRRLYGYFYRATGDVHEAEDLLSEISLRLVRRIGAYDDRGRFDQWLFRIAANMIRDRIRRRRTKPPAASLSIESDDGDSPADRLEGPSAAVDERLLLAEASAQVQAALQRLDETTRQMILLRHFGEASFREIAEAFGCPLGTALAKVHRGLKALRQQLEARHDGP